MFFPSSALDWDCDGARNSAPVTTGLDINGDGVCVSGGPNGGLVGRIPLPTADPCLAFARVGLLDLKLGNPDDKNTFAASIFLSTSPACAPCLRERIAPHREKLLADATAWVNAQPAEQLIGNAGRERTRAAFKGLCDKALFNGQPGFATEVVFDQYFVRHKGLLKLEAK